MAGDNESKGSGRRRASAVDAPASGASGLAESTAAFAPEEMGVSSNTLRLKLQGRALDDDDDKARLAALSEFGITRKDGVAVAGPDRGGGDEFALEVQPDEVVAIELDGGAKIWVRGDELPRTLGQEPVRGQRGDEIKLPERLPPARGERGVAGWVIKGLEVLGVKVPGKEEAGTALAERIAQAIESKVVPEPGLYRWSSGMPINTAENRATMRVPGGKVLDSGDRPWLLFLHGTFSHAGGAFGELTGNPERWRRLTDRYGERVLAFEHRSLTRSPIENARDLMRQLPIGARLHLVSHSRGGLVGELLCRSRLQQREGAQLRDRAEPFDDDEVKLFDGDAQTVDRAALLELQQLLATRRPLVDRFVRVACPARGTALASDRLDRWLNVFFNLVSLAGGKLGPVGEALDLLEALVTATVKTRLAPTVLPGLAAMMPTGSPLVSLLNRPNLVADADLTAIKGDIEPEGVRRRLAVWFADAFFGADHDLVVDTPSMEGGLERKSGSRSWLARGADVDHFSYFRNPRSAEHVLAALLSDRADELDFDRIDAARGERRAARGIAMPSLGQRGTSRKPLVFVLPGISGSQLSVAGVTAWINLPWLAAGAIRRLAVGQDGIAAVEPIGLYYGQICQFLDRSHDVRPWPYDWRLSIETTGASLAVDVAKALEETDQPVRILAHSMGGLVARIALDTDGLLEKLKRRAGSRLVMLGTPNGGSYGIPLMLMGRNRLMGYLALMDLKFRKRDHLEVVTRFPGLLEMLPADSPPLFDARRWKELAALDPDRNNWVPPRERDLDAARTVRDRLDQLPIDPDFVRYVAGQGATIRALESSADQPDPVSFPRTLDGDGQVLWETGIPRTADGSLVATWYISAAHGDLARHEPSFRGVEELLLAGTTQLLADRRPEVARAEVKPLEPITREPIAIFPTEADIADAGIGARPERLPLTATPAIRLRVVNGDLSYSPYPVMVGHYRGDTIAGSERQLDKALGGRLRKRYDLGLYPGELATVEVVIDESDASFRTRVPGAVIIGLGEVTRLTPGQLREALAHGLLAVGLRNSEARTVAASRETERAHRPLGIATILVGSGDGGLSVQECVASLALAATDAQQRLVSVHASPLEEIIVIELNEHQAIRIWHVLDDLLRRPELGRCLELHPSVDEGEGFSRVMLNGEDPNWWRPIQIVEEKLRDGASVLRFTSTGRRARAEAQLVPDNRTFAEMFVHSATKSGSDASGMKSASRALFELLWPNELKDRSGDDTNLRLILDEASARFPWELLDDRRPWEGRVSGGEAESRRPPAVRFGVVRQLITDRFRRLGRAPTFARKALVIGDPRGGAPADEFPRLDGARREAEAVARLLDQQGFDVTTLIGDDATPDMVVRHLFDHAWAVVHIAAHGVVDHVFRSEKGLPPQEQSQLKPHTGVVLGDRLVLGPTILEQLPLAPDIVFVNCCNLATIKPDVERRYIRERRPELAASVAVQLVKMGCPAVIAAGWEIDDAAAVTFANAFYRALLGGAKFGDVVRDARARCFEEHPQVNSWGAYQCYGEPDWRFDPLRGEASVTSNDFPRFAAPAEAFAQIDLIARRATVSDDRDSGRLRERLDRLADAVNGRGWQHRADLAEAFARAYRDIGCRGKAINWFATALESERADTSIAALEQLANLRVRQAEDEFSAIPAAEERRREKLRADALERIDASIQSLKSLVAAAGDTSERRDLIGSCYKRRAIVAEGEARTQSLEDMQDAYRHAAALARERGLPNVFYPELMAATAELLLALRGGVPKTKARKHIREVLASLTGHSSASLDFWLRVAKADARGLLALADGKFGQPEQDELVESYKRVWTELGKPGQLASIVEQYRFLHKMLADTTHSELVSGLEEMSQQILALHKPYN